jgi:hypothetical protein
MTTRTLLYTAIAAAMLATAPGWAQTAAKTNVAAAGDGFQQEFNLSQCRLSPTGSSAYFILEPGHQLILEEKGEKLEITVLNETRTIDGVVTRVVQAKEWKDGELYEIARDYYAICPETKDVYYFGEDVDFYEKGKIKNHDGSWLAGKNGAKAGLIMPGTPKVGMKYYQEVAPGVAMDRAEIMKVDGGCKTPAGTFKNCVRVKEGTALDPSVTEYKTYAPGIGMVRDADKVLIKHGNVKAKM